MQIFDEGVKMTVERRNIKMMGAIRRSVLSNYVINHILKINKKFYIIYDI